MEAPIDLKMRNMPLFLLPLDPCEPILRLTGLSLSTVVYRVSELAFKHGLSDFLLPKRCHGSVIEWIVAEIPSNLFSHR